jgi:hypothetical protein
MNISMYQASVPVIVRTLNNLVVILEKASAYAEERKIEPAALIGTRLFPDMFPLSRQVQIASDNAKGCAARLAGETAPSYEDTETTFPELIARLRKTIDYVSGFKPEQIDGSETREVTIKLRTGELKFNGLDYMQGFALPNIYFHATTTYALLRHNGVPVGKMDFLGSMPQ